MVSKNSLRSVNRKGIILLIILLVSCIETFDIQSIGSEDMFVVEGFISTEMKQHRVILSRTSPKFLSSCDDIPSVDVPVEEIGAYYAFNGEGLIISETSAGILHLHPRYCCDCTNLDTNVKPSFWP